MCAHPPELEFTQWLVLCCKMFLLLGFPLGGEISQIYLQSAENQKKPHYLCQLKMMIDVCLKE